jgi:predicted ribonuclease YlaK
MAHSSAAKHGRHNLKAQATALLGRDQDVANVCHLVLGDAGRLVTLTGVGGCGKTRLALGVAEDSMEAYRDGVWLAEHGLPN